MTVLSMDIMGGSIRCIGIGDEVTKNGQKVKSSTEYVMIKLSDMKNPVFINKRTYRAFVDLVNDGAFQKKYRHWIDGE